MRRTLPAPPARLGLHVAAGVVLGAGVAALIEADLGVAPYDVLSTGTASFFDVSVGAAILATGASLLVLAMLLGRMPRAGTVVAIVAVSLTVNTALDLLTTPASLPLRGVLAFVGACATLIGITGTIVSNAGEGPIELFMLGVRDRTDWPIAAIRVGMEVSYVSIGWVLGGEVGVVTVLYAMLIGPALHTTLARLE